MLTKKHIVSGFLVFLSGLFGYTLGKLDFFGFLNNTHGLSILYLIFSILIWYILSVINFLLDFSKKHNFAIVYSTSALAFALIFLSIQPSMILAAINALFLFIFLQYTSKATLKRAELFVKFIPAEIFLPVARRGFNFLMIIFVLVGFFQTRQLGVQTGYVSPSILRVIIKPVTVLINKQLGAQLQAQLGDKFEQSIGTKDREKIVHFFLAEVVESMLEGKTRQEFGITPQNIPVDKTIVYPDGQIDVTPTLEAILPQLSEIINKRVGYYLPLVPFVVAMVVLLILQPIIVLFTLAITPLTIGIFFLLLRYRFLTVRYESVNKEIISL